MEFEVSQTFVKILENILAWMNCLLVLTFASYEMEIITISQNSCGCESETIFEVLYSVLNINYIYSISTLPITEDV